MSDTQPAKVNLDDVARLVDQLERDLGQVRSGGTSIDTLRTEVEQLRRALDTAEPSHGELNRGLHGVRERLAALSDELFGDALKGSDYIARIGRLLGLS